MNAKCLKCHSYWNISIKKEALELRTYQCPICSSKKGQIREQANQEVVGELQNYNKSREFYNSPITEVGFDAAEYFSVGDKIEYVRFNSATKEKKKKQSCLIKGTVAGIYPSQLLIQCENHKENIPRFPVEDEQYRLLRRKNHA